jgi:myo-inositol-1(or 4)-monophosphatase
MVTDVPSMMEKDTWLEVAVQSAQRAGAYLATHRATRPAITKELPRDVKLRADHESEEIIVNELQRASDFRILTEERGIIEAPSEEKDYLWIVDPLDGSVNYLEGIPFCCVSIGLWHAGEPLLGVVFDFVHDQLFKGIVGQGARLNDEPISVKTSRRIDQSVLCTGFPVSMDFGSPSLTSFINQVREFKKVRLLGSAALSLAYVAAGRADAYYERNIKIWDVAAGLALVKAADGKIAFSGFPESKIVNAFGGSALLIVV